MRKIISFVFKYFKEYSLSGHVKLTLITRQTNVNYTLNSNLIIFLHNSSYSRAIGAIEKKKNGVCPSDPSPPPSYQFCT